MGIENPNKNIHTIYIANEIIKSYYYTNAVLYYAVLLLLLLKTGQNTMHLVNIFLLFQWK